ncbi:MAG: TonB-dependent receptor, partial [Oxalobacteraceae bacterium]
MRLDFRKRLLASTLLLGIATPAFSQTAEIAAPTATPNETLAASAAPVDGDTIVVTGSRLGGDSLTQASPISVISAKEIALSGQINVESVLKDLPQLVPSTTGASNNPGGGVATADLRGLGSTRTLVLVNNRRYVAYDSNQVVDLNTIPAALIERVDIVTGGRSAVYGSDAIGGVVNFVMKKDFSGVQA